MRSISTLALIGVLGTAGPALAGGVTLSSSNPAQKTKRPPSGISISKGTVAPAATARRTPKDAVLRRAEPGKVLINVTNADLRKVVLPLFKEQAGISVRYSGAPRKVTLRLIEPVAWEQALGLVAQFTKTHIATDAKEGPILRDKWGGEIQRDVVFDDLNGQVADRNRSLRASADRRRAAKFASFKRDTPITRQPVIPTIKIGGGKLRLGSRGGPARPYSRQTPRARPYISRGRAPAPYVSRNRPAAPYVSNGRRPRPNTSRNRPAAPYVSRGRRTRPYVSRGRRSRPYVSRPYVSTGR